MTKTFFFLLFTFPFILSFAQQNQKFVDAVVKKRLSKFSDVGLVIGVHQKGKTHYYSYGTLHVAGKTKIDSSTVFEIGSATKTFTALLLAQEIEKGTVKPFDFFDKYLPKDVDISCQMKNKILMTDLATHQSGLPNLSNDQYFEDLMAKDPNNPFRFVDSPYLYNILSKTDSLKGYRQYQYNNFAYSLLGNLLALQAKIPFEEVVTKKILEPLKMTSTTFSIPKNKNTAGLYSQRGVPQKAMILNAANPAGGLHSNAIDLIKYLKSYLYNPNFSLAVKRIEQTYYEDSKKKLGLGWEIGEGFLEKDGDTFGNSSLMRYSEQNKVAVVVLSNHQNGQLVRDIINDIYAEAIRKN
ncbi:serine hydrolase [Chryseobacterium wangxinyae]|uniref:serine hydrolase domain-containing protein n=1 Tax=Chryseobacterium sp. CY350 TaxID=2997336 RepID=UPI00226F0710|nr:serine hydrolase domain-containing protein [Chryseobacterium sp. CY350]MCY0977132.1 serine hydrolase [Chryseobacterium sp. CY350]WBZ95847.1 serine hydrolase [Chryseobacterium sp. CY350]